MFAGATVAVGGVKLRFAATVTSLLSPIKPVADAVTLAEPKLTPVTCAFGTWLFGGEVWPIVAFMAAVIAIGLRSFRSTLD